MKKALTICTVAALLLMASVAISGNDTGFSLFMGTGIDHVIARVIIAIALMVILVVPPPRVRSLRATLAIVSLLVITFAITQTINYHLQPLDSVAYFLSGILLAIDAGEVDLEARAPVAFPKPHHL